MENLKGKKVTTEESKTIGLVLEHILEDRVPVKWPATTKAGYVVTIEFVKDLKVVE